MLPSVEPAAIYADKAGPEILEQMYAFELRGRQLCLRPEGTATCQLLARGPLSRAGETRLWYETRCWRYETPQAGRYREFSQFGVEILNVKQRNRSLYRQQLLELATAMVRRFYPETEVRAQVQRGLAYYLEDGFELVCPQLGAQKQVAGGGSYAEGIGFAVGLDRLVLAALDAGTVT